MMDMDISSPMPGRFYPRIAVIGTSWTLTLLSSCISQHNAHIEWHVQHLPSFYYTGMPLSSEALTCYGQNHYMLPLALSSSWLGWLHSAGSLYPPATPHHVLQKCFPDVKGLRSAQTYALQLSYWQSMQAKMHQHAEPPKVHLQSGQYAINNQPYDAIIWLSTHPFIRWPKPMPAIPRTYLYGYEKAKDSWHIDLKAPEMSPCLRWETWEQESWLEDWSADTSLALWIIESPFCIEKFLNKKNIFEVFLKKIPFFARQSGIRVR